MFTDFALLDIESDMKQNSIKFFMVEELKITYHDVGFLLSEPVFTPSFLKLWLALAQACLLKMFLKQHLSACVIYGVKATAIELR